MSTATETAQTDTNDSAREEDFDDACERPFAKRFKRSLKEGEMTDIDLVADDGSGERVPASRFAFGVLSPVLRAMLYGHFQEATSRTVTLQGCTKRMLQILVEFSCTGELDIKARWPEESDPSDTMEEVVTLANYAYSIETLDLRDRLIIFASTLLDKHPPLLACIAYTLANKESTPSVLDHSLKVIRQSPYLSLLGVGKGAGFLTKEKIAEILQDEEVLAAEITMFKSILAWRKTNLEKYTNVDEICKELANYIDYSLM